MKTDFDREGDQSDVDGCDRRGPIRTDAKAWIEKGDTDYILQR